MTQTVRSAQAEGGSSSSAGGRLVSLDGRILPLRSVALRGLAVGGYARLTFEQHFHNPYSEPLRVAYQFPLPVEAAVSGYSFRIGRRRVEGRVDRLAAAREYFEEALLEGRVAAVLDQDRSSLFAQEIGNIPPGVEVVAELVIDQPLRWLEEGSWEWRFPTTVAPRYLGGQGLVADSKRISVDVTEGPLPVKARLALSIGDELDPGSRPESPSHAIQISPDVKGINVTVVDDGRPMLDRDVVVRWPAAQRQIGVTLDVARPLSGPLAATAYGLLTIMPPYQDEKGPAQRRELIILLDMSGSMAGKPLEQARQVVTRLIETLRNIDRLELIAFATEPRRWKSRPMPALAANRESALLWLRSLCAGGGTEMHAGVAAALTPLDDESQRQVVVITDGEIGFESEIVSLIAMHLPTNCRLHTVGVGPAVNRTLTAGAARAGRGAEIIIGLDEDPRIAAERLVTRLVRPLLTELDVSGSALVDHAPLRLPDVHAAMPVLASVQLHPAGGELRVSGRLAGKPWELILPVANVESGSGPAALPQRYAREMVDDLEMKRAAGNRLVDGEIERLGLQYQIVTRRTSWIAVSEEPAVNPGAPIILERIPQSLPQGVSAEGLGLAKPRVSREASPLPRDLMAPGLSLVEVTALRERILSAATPVIPALRRVSGRLNRRRDREFVFEISLDQPLSWSPSRVYLCWEGGFHVRGVIDRELTTHDGEYETGQVIRLVVRLTKRMMMSRVPPWAPVSIRLRSGRTPIEV